MRSPKAPRDTAHDEIGLLSLILSLLVGYDLRIVPKYAGARTAFERMKIVSIGFSTFVPAVMGFFTAYLFMAPYMSNGAAHVTAAGMAAIAIFAVDCMIIRSLSSTGGAGMLVRLVLGACLSITGADPLVNYVYSKSINTEIAGQLNHDKEQRREQIQANLTQNEQGADRINDSMADAEKELRAYSPENITAQHLRDRVQRKNELAGAARARAGQYQRDRERKGSFEQGAPTGPGPNRNQIG